MNQTVLFYLVLSFTLGVAYDSCQGLIVSTALAIVLPMGLNIALILLSLKMLLLKKWRGEHSLHEQWAYSSKFGTLSEILFFSILVGLVIICMRGMTTTGNPAFLLPLPATAVLMLVRYVRFPSFLERRS